MAIRLAIQWMLPAETYADAPMATSEISIFNDNDFLIVCLSLIIHDNVQRRSILRNIKLNFVFYHVAFFQDDIIRNIAFYALKLLATMFRNIFVC